MSHRNRVRATRGGFTLIEAIVIIVILGVIAALVAPRLLGRIGESKQSRAKADRKSTRLNSRVPGDVNFDFDVVSYGNDGQPGGEDEGKDIVGG